MGQKLSKMTNLQRAKQFMPFAALKGFEERLAAVAKYRERRKVLSDDQLQELDQQWLKLEEGNLVRIVYYYQDTHQSTEGIVQKIDEPRHVILVQNLKIRLSNIMSLEILENL